MRGIGYLLLVALLLVMALACVKPTEAPAPVPPVPSQSAPQATASAQAVIIDLPEPRHDSEVSLEQALLQRRSVRSYKDEPLTLQEVSQLLWAAQGFSDPRGLRTAPSAGALYPLEVYAVVGNVQGLAPAVYQYLPEKHGLEKVMDGDKRHELAGAALGQKPVSQGAVDIVFTAVYSRTTGKYGEGGVKYVHIEVGHAGQNVCLQATALGLGAVTVGAFQDDQVARLLNLPQDEQPLYIIPIGRK